jgi:hypothetical protein
MGSKRLKAFSLVNKKSRPQLRALIFLGVLLLHVAIVLPIIYSASQVVRSASQSTEPLLLMLFPHKESAPQDILVPSTRHPATRSPKAPPPRSDAITIPPEVPAQPPIDWEHEAQLAVEDGIAAAEKEKDYRNLAGMSSAQRTWLQQNRMVPMSPGIRWTHPRVEFDKDTGIPIVWINDHCVLVLLFPFCAIGHIEPNGELFKHMRDPDP